MPKENGAVPPVIVLATVSDLVGGLPVSVGVSLKPITFWAAPTPMVRLMVSQAGGTTAPAHTPAVGSWYPVGAAISCTVQVEPEGPLKARMLACTSTWLATGTLVELTMTGCSAGSAELLTHATRKVAGLAAGTTLPVFASRFSTRWSPPTTKQAAEALRTPPG